MAIGDSYRLTVVMRGPQGQDIVNTFALRQTTGFIVGYSGPAEALIAAFQADVESDYTGTFHSGVEIVKYRAQNINGSPEVWETILTTPVAGGLGGGMLPPQTAAEVLWKTGIPGRANAGKVYLPPASITYCVGGAWQAGYETNVNAFAAVLASFGDGITTGGWEQVVWSDVNNAARLRTSLQLWPYSRIQARRGAGIGS